MRFVNDPEYGKGCLQARLGNWTKEFVDIINSRYLPPVKLHHSNPSHQEHYNNLMNTIAVPSTTENFQYTVFVTPDNATRTAINSSFISSFYRQINTSYYPIRVIAQFHGELDGASELDISWVMQLPDNALDRLKPFIDLYIGMPIIITQNIEPLKGVANGSYGILHDLQFPKDTTYSQLFDEQLQITVLIPNKKPLLAWVRMDRGLGASSPPNNPNHPHFNSPDMFPVFPRRAFKSQLIKLPSGREIKLRITQLPLISAVGSTVYKLQGETCTSLVVCDWKAKVGPCNKPQQGYLIVSRPKTRYGLITLRLLSSSLTSYFQPPPHAINEDKRLLQLHNEAYEHLNPDTTNM
jgi:hypothetical protein